MKVSVFTGSRSCLFKDMLSPQWCKTKIKIENLSSPRANGVFNTVILLRGFVEIPLFKGFDFWG